jgi:type IV pilus assembly protein PilB
MGAKDTLIGRLLGNAEKFTDEQITHTIDLLIEHAIKHGATDIHIEPQTQFVLVRYRIDGDLRSMHKLPRAALGTMTNQFRELAALPHRDTPTPQEGQYSVTVNKQTFAVRVSTVPVLGGDKIVLHLAPQFSEPHNLEALGLWGNTLTAVQHALSRPQGLVLVSGPKRSGKTTTLYSLLNTLNTPNVSIATVEDPIKHTVPGITQSQVHPPAGISVAEGVRAVLRQDPNIVMVSNVADEQTGDLVVHAATTGHGVLAGMHAENAARAILQLRAMDVQPFLLASGIRLSLAERLARKLCVHCRERHQLDEQERASLEKSFGIASDVLRRRVHELEQQAAREQLGRADFLHSTVKGVSHLWRANPEGCHECNYTGFKGQVALFEALAVSDHIRNLLLGRPTISALEAAAYKEGFIPLQLDGLIKALRGETTAQEVLRITPHSYALPATT